MFEKTRRSEEYVKWLQKNTYEHTLTGLSQQRHLTGRMRSMLFDWMMQVSAEFTFKRDTFYLAITYVDKALVTVPNIRKEEFQLLGLMALCVAAKIEEIHIPRLKDWATAAGNGYNFTEMRQMERKLLYSLSWKTYPTTAYNWLYWLMTQWDSYVSFKFSAGKLIVFTKPNRKAYKRFREVTQMLDLGALHERFMTIHVMKLALGLLYLAVNKYLWESEYSMIGKGDDYQKSGELQDLFSEFMKSTVQVESFEEIYSAVTLFHQFLDLEFNCDQPLICQIQSKKKTERHYVEFLSYQTYDGNIANKSSDI